MIKKHYQPLISCEIDTPLGVMLAITDEHALHFLQFMDYPHFARDLEKLQARTESTINLGKNTAINAIKAELQSYFAGTLQCFSTTLHLYGSTFQKLVWSTLLDIPYGKTWSYLEQATAIGKPSAYRAVASANAANQIAIVIPCHRIINHNGQLGGYAGGISRKQWLIDQERQRSHDL